jgi:SAM-dependent methyltransferase
MSPTESAVGTEPTQPRDRKRLGAWYTPEELIAVLVDQTLEEDWVEQISDHKNRALRVLDPACGDGRLLEAVGTRLTEWGVDHVMIGVDIDPAAAEAARQRLGASAVIIEGDALSPAVHHRISALVGSCDLVVANPPFISQMASHTTRGGASRHGGGPYADVAAEFCSMALSLTTTRRGRIALILPQSLLTARDAGPIRARIDALSIPLWDWHSDEFHFDAAVRVCAIGRELTEATPNLSVPHPPKTTAINSWGHLIAQARGVPQLPLMTTAGELGDRADLNANFRDQYYGLVPAVRDSESGQDQDRPPLITTGLIDPGICHWGSRPARFAKQTLRAPRVDLTALTPTMQAWAHRKLVPKVLVATQTRIIEAVADPKGEWLPGVPITSVVPTTGETDSERDYALWEIAAVLTSPIATVAAWWHSAGSGLSSTSIRITPRVVACTPWPSGDLSEAVAHLQAGRINQCGLSVATAYEVDPQHPAIIWWSEKLAREFSGSGRP